jgi:hypothetical protein
MCSVCDPENIFMASKFWLFTIFSKNTHKTNVENGWKGTNSNPPGPFWNVEIFVRNGIFKILKV